jgi:hypothetical protein
MRSNSSSVVTFLALPVLVWGILGGLLTGLAPSVAAVEVGAGGDRYAGSGGLVLPGGTDSGTRAEVASCTNCTWRLSDPCSADGGPCLAVTRGCSQMSYLLRLRVSSDGGASWSDRGLVCIPPAGPITVGDVSVELRREFERIVPALEPRAQPSRGIVTQIPVNFISGHPAGLAPSSHQILGRSVVLRPAVRWSWEFGDGATMEADSPGNVYPGGGLRHAYRRAGPHTARVQALWSGSFEVDGLGPFPVSGVIRQSASLVLSVGEGRAVLVP